VDRVNLAILQARMGSSRLPGKALRPILGMPMTLRQIERVQRAGTIDQLVVATSTDPDDDILASTVEDAGVTVRRGPLDDVLARFVQVVNEFDPDQVIRLTGDNPLHDPAVIDLVVGEHLAAGVDYTSTGLTRTFPYGLDVEAVRPAVLRELAAAPTDAEEREHVTLGVYRRPETFSLHAVTQIPDRSDLRWTVDYPEDLRWVTTIFERLHPVDPWFGQQDVIDLIDREPALRRTLADVPS
jgi:spore coat polysaccharide biosynthesis protein SpsF